MPPINRTNIVEYVILSITDGTTKMLDLTTLANKRNYKHKLINELKAQLDKRTPVYNEFKKSNVDAIEVEVLDAINGTYLDAINYMNKIATKYNYKTPKAINNNVLDIQLELQAKRLSEPHTQINNSEVVKDTSLKVEPSPTEPVKEEPTLTSEVVKKPKKAVQKIKLKQVEEEPLSGVVAELIEEAIKTPITTPPTITIDYEKDEELEPVERLSEPHTQIKNSVVRGQDRVKNTPTTSGIVKLTKKQEQQKNKLIENNKQTIIEYDTLKKQKESLEAKMNTLHLEILTNYTTLANTFQYVDGSISDFNFE